MKNSNIATVLSSLESLYLEKKYDDAKHLLLNNKKHFSLGHFSFNMGTLYAKSNDMAAARYHLEKAQMQGYGGTKLVNNLKVVKSNLSVQDITNSPSFYDRSVDFGMSIPDGLYLSISLVMVLIFLVLKKINFIKSIKTLLVWLVVAAMPFTISKIYFQRITLAISLGESVVREGPSTIYTEIGRLKAGTKFIVGDVDNGWMYIKHPLSQVGWVYRDKIALY